MTVPLVGRKALIEQCPFNPIDDRIKWIEYMYKHSFGTRQDLADYCERYRMAAAIWWDKTGEPAQVPEMVREALTYLLRTEGCEWRKDWLLL
jgi:hypothetical protein